MDAFGILYERYKSPMYGYCVNMLKDREQAADAMQEIFVKAQQGCAGLRESSAFRSWLFSIARNMLFTALKRAEKGEEIEDDDVIDHDSPFELVTRSDTRDLLGALVQRLKPIYREVLYYREYENLSYREIAEAIAIPESLVKARLLKGRRALVELFRKTYGRDDVC